MNPLAKLSQIPLLRSAARWYRLRAARQYGHRYVSALWEQVADRKQLFTFYHHSNFWGSRESVPGPGSTKASTEVIRRELPALLRRLSVQTLLDAPCGDYTWIQHLELDKEIAYVGADIVEQLVYQNNLRYGNNATRFQPIDITCDAPPAADLWLCRDCLPHLSEQDIQSVVCTRALPLMSYEFFGDGFLASFRHASFLRPSSAVAWAARRLGFRWQGKTRQRRSRIQRDHPLNSWLSYALVLGAVKE